MVGAEEPSPPDLSQGALGRTSGVAVSRQSLWAVGQNAPEVLCRAGGEQSQPCRSCHGVGWEMCEESCGVACGTCEGVVRLHVIRLHYAM